MNYILNAASAELTVPNSLASILTPDFIGIGAKWGMLNDPITRFNQAMLNAQAEGKDFLVLSRNGRFAVVPLLTETVWDVLRTKESEQRYNRGDSIYLIQNRVQEAIFFASGEDWESQRKEAQTVLTNESNAKMYGQMQSAADDLTSRWKAAFANGDTVDPTQEFPPYTLGVLCETLFDVKRPDDISELQRSLKLLFSTSSRRTYFPQIEALAPRNFAQEVFRRLRKSIATVEDVADGLIMQRMADLREDGGEGRHDLLTVMAKAHIEGFAHDRNKHNWVKLRQKVVSMLVAGHETTSAALTWIFYNLAKHPEYQKKIADEIRAVCGDRAPNPADVKNLKFTQAFINEAIRLYPPFWMYKRFVLKDHELGGMPIQKDMTVFIAAFLMHRNANYWPDPEKFDPSRFSDEAVRERSIRYKGSPPFMPFGGGPHSCIGMFFANQEMIRTVAAVVRELDLSLAEPEKAVLPRANISMVPDGAIPIRGTPRQAYRAAM